mgnify:CR=1 FL=1
MKKYIIIAAAALVAAAACSKVETVEAPGNDAITFNVVDYATATRADETSSLKDEGFEKFTTYAWIHPDGAEDGTPFMTPATVEFDASVPQWAPTDRTYYWPKSGASYINFFSFAGTKVPTSMETEGEVAYTNVEIVKTDNILVADGAYGYQNNSNVKYKLDGVTEGVPTLFRHVLAQVYFDVKLDATVVDDENYEFTAAIDELTLTCANQGSLSMTFAAPTSTPGQSQFTTTDGWVAGTSTGSLANTESVSLTAKGKYATEFSKLMDWSTVMPQVLTTEETESAAAQDLVKVSFTYTLTTKWTAPDGSDAEDTEFTETITVKDVPLSKFTTVVTKWDMNTRYKYHITINPVSGEKILFDPAVEAWVDGGESSYTYPEATTTTSGN